MIFKKILNTLVTRIKKTTHRDSKPSMIVVLVAFIISSIISTITAIGIPTGPSFKNRAYDILLATGLNSIGFILFLFIFSIILSLLFIPLPRLLTSSVIYTGILHGAVLHYAKAGMNFSIFIGIMTTVFSVMIGLVMILFFSHRISRWILTSLAAILVIIFIVISLPNSGTIDVIGDGEQHPASPGSYDTIFFTYGSGTDLHRKEYATDVTETTPPVDASHFITRWSDKREKFWGFNPESFPINGRVWMPKEDGTFPIILMVHGNHTMEYFSTDGYDYLGELLASHGYIFISVDEDYVNYSNHVGQPNDNYQLRTWLLLKHLVQLKEFNYDSDSRFYKKIDFHNVAFAGHSRGGQAASMAANYERFFDDPILLTQLKDIQIKAVAAISPTEKLVDDKRATLDDIAYMVLHGSKDSDVYDFRGNKQFHRTHLDEDSNLIKSAVYIENANHVHFNTSWGTNDLSFPRGVFLDRSSLIDKHDQQLIAKAYFTAFFKKVFNGDATYEALLQNPNTQGDWLPDVNIVSQYRPSTYKTIEKFNRFKEPTGHFNSFHEYEVTTPKGRTGNNHPQDVLELSWENEASYSLKLSDRDFKNAQDEDAENIVLTVANTLPGSQPNIKVSFESEAGDQFTFESSISDVIEIDNTTFGLFDSFFRDGKYEESWEPIFQTIEVPIGHVENIIGGSIDLTIHFYGNEGKVMLEEIGVY